MQQMIVIKQYKQTNKDTIMDEFNKIANEYGYSVDNEGFIYIKNKNTNTKIITSGKKIKIVNEEFKKLLFTGSNKPSTLAAFLKSYWYASKV